jgi:hypothetical protein
MRRRKRDVRCHGRIYCHRRTLTRQPSSAFLAWSVLLHWRLCAEAVRRRESHLHSALLAGMVGRQRVHVLALALPVLARVKRDGYVSVVEELVHSSNVPHVVMVGPALHAIAVAQHRAIRPGRLRDRTRRLRCRLPHATHRASSQNAPPRTATTNHNTFHVHVDCHLGITTLPTSTSAKVSLPSLCPPLSLPQSPPSS